MSRSRSELPAAKEPGEVVGRPDRLRDLGVEELGIGETDERHPEHSVALRADELGRDLQRKPRLARAACAGERDQPRAVGEHRDELLDLALPADERARGDGQVGRVERPQRREVAVAELVQALGVDEILEPVLSEVADRDVALEKSSRRLGEDDLASVRGGRDAGGAVDVHPDVSLVGDDRLAGVEAHADADRAGLERSARVAGRGHGVRRPREGDEERVALGVDLDAVRGCAKASLSARRCSASRSA